MSRFILKAVFLLVGLLMLALGGMSAVELATQPSLGRAQKAQAAIPNWPTTTGRVEELQVQRDLTGSDSQNWHPSFVKYAYRVADRDYRSNRLNRGTFGTGDRSFDDTSVEGVEAKLGKLFPISSGQRQGPKEEEGRKSHLRFSGRELVYRYSLDAPVKVFYDPEDPGASVLDNRDFQPPITWLEYVGGPLSQAYVLIGLGLIVAGAAFTPVLQRLWGAPGRLTISSDGQRYRYKFFDLLHSILGAYLGIFFLVAAYGVWINSFVGRSVSTLAAIVDGLLIAFLGAFGFLLACLRGSTTLDLDARVLVADTRISLVVFSIPIRRTRKAMSEFVGLRLRMMPIAGTSKIPASTECDVSLMPKSGRGMILFTSKLPPGRKEPPPQVLALVERLKQQTGLECTSPDAGAQSPL